MTQTDLLTKAAATGLGDSLWLAMVCREMHGHRRSSTAGYKPCRACHRRVCDFGLGDAQ